MNYYVRGHSGKSILPRIRRSRLSIVVQSFVLAGIILQPVPMARSYWTDSNNDGVKEFVADPDPAVDPGWLAEDSDFDEMTNGAEAIYGSDPYCYDSDFDGLTDKDEHDLTPLNDPWSWSSDGSGYSDHDRYYHDLLALPLTVNYNTLTSGGLSFYSYRDADGDGIRNGDDTDPLNNDRDGDGIVNWQDSYMDDPNNGATPPGETPPDADGDGIPDSSDPYPNGSYTYGGVEYGGVFVDSDGDSIPDPADPFPNGSYIYQGVEYDGTMIDQDNDGIPDFADPFPNGSYTYNGVEYGGGWIDSDNDGIPDAFDPFPNGSYWYNATEYSGPWIDSDNDAIPDAFDPFPNGSYVYNGTEYPGNWVDQDYDGIPDPQDAFPTLSGSYWYGGVEYGGSWTDSDSDQVPDPADIWPNIAWSYTFGNVTYPGTWVDTDNDGTPDPADAFPNGSYTYNGVEYAGAFVDSDGDWVPDPADTFPNTAWSYWYNGIEYAGGWVDTDYDSIPDPADQWPGDWWNNQPHFTFNGQEYPGYINEDRDQDNVPDAADAWPDDLENGLDSDQDGLTNYDERTQHHTNPLDVDSDDDFLTDYEELFIYKPVPQFAGIDPNNAHSLQSEYLDSHFVNQTGWADTDVDGLPDRVEDHYAELGYGLNKSRAADANGDLDGDGWSNLYAYNQGWDLVQNRDAYDFDGDGITDAQEDTWNVARPGILNRSWSMDSTQDSDGDGLFNFEEIQFGLDPGNPNTSIDNTEIQFWGDAVDGSGNPTFAVVRTEDGNDFEAIHDKNRLASSGAPINPPFVIMNRMSVADWDADGMPDWWEHRYTLSLRSNNSQADADYDGLNDLGEWQHGTHPRLPDSDGDGFSDGVEVTKNTDPTLSSSKPGTTTTETPAAESFAGAISPGNFGAKPSVVLRGYTIPVPPTPYITARVTFTTEVEDFRTNYSNHRDWTYTNRYDTVTGEMVYGGIDANDPPTVWGARESVSTSSVVSYGASTPFWVRGKFNTITGSFDDDYDQDQTYSEYFDYPYIYYTTNGYLDATGHATDKDEGQSATLKMIADSAVPTKVTYKFFKSTNGGAPVPFSLIIIKDETESMEVAFNPPAGGWIDVWQDGEPVIEPPEEPAASEGISITAADASGPVHRRISLQGHPLADSPPAVRPEAKEDPEETYIDALGMELRQSVADLRVPLGASLLNLEVKRELSHETWSGQGGLLPRERPDRPFGVGWRSNLAACLQITENISDSKLDQNATVVDETGAAQSYIRNGEGEWLQGVAASNFVKVRENKLTTDELTGTYTKSNGTVCSYEFAFSQQILQASGYTGGSITTVRWFRLTDAVDRCGNTLIYEYSDARSLIPHTISSPSRLGQTISITQNLNGRVTAVQGPDGRRINYGYLDCVHELDNSGSPGGSIGLPEQCLASVTSPGATVLYKFHVRTEHDPTPSGENDPGFVHPVQHAMLREFTDANGNIYKFDYKFNSESGNNSPPGQNAPTPNYEYIDISNFMIRAQLSLPPLVTEVKLPDNTKATFDADKHIQLSHEAEVVDLRAVMSSVAVDGSLYEWRFDDPGVCAMVKAWPVTDPISGSYTIFFEKMEIRSKSMMPPGSEIYEFDFGASMAVGKVTDYSGNVTQYTYGRAAEPGPQIGEGGKFGRKVIRTAGKPPVGYASDQPTLVVNALNQTTTFEFATDSLELQATTDAAGVKTVYALQPGTGLRTSKKVYKLNGSTPEQQTDYEYEDPRFAGFVTKETIKTLTDDHIPDQVTNFVADAWGRVSRSYQTINGLTLDTYFGYDCANRKRWVKDSNGNVTEWRYDAAGRLEKMLPPNCGDGQKQTSYAYDAAGNLKTQTDEKGVKIFHDYDVLQRKIKTTVDLDGNGLAGTRAQDLVTNWTYNAMNLVETVTDPREVQTRNVYDAIGRPSTVTVAYGTPLAATTTYVFGLNSGGSVFDVSGFKPTKVTDPRGNETITVYDKLYRSTSVFKTDGGTTTTQYDVAGNPSIVTDPLGKVTTTVFDTLKRPIQVDYADGTTTKTRYTSSGLVYQTEDELHRFTDIYYDAIGRKTSVKQPEVFTGYGTQRTRPETKFAYDLNGNLTGVTDPLGNVTTTYYDARNRPWKVCSPAVYDPVLGVNIRPTVSTKYDGVGNKVQVTDPLGNVTDTVYDRANRMVQVTAPPVPVVGSTVVQRPVTLTSYDANGNVLTVTDANSVVTTNTYDERNRLKTTLDGAGITVSFGYDAAGNRTSVTDGKIQTTSFTYDGLNRVLTETTPGGVIVTNTYNAVNKISRLDAKGQKTTYTYDDRHRLDTMNYFEVGAQAPHKSRSHVYDDAGRLTGVAESNASESAVGYAYDELGRTVAETSQGVVHLHTYDLAGHELVRQNQSTGRRIDRSYDAAGRLVSVTEGGRQTWVYYDLAGRVAARRMGNGTWAGLNYDALGRVLISTTYQNAAQNAAQILFEHEWDYDLAGNVKEQRETWPGSPDRAPGIRITSMDYDGAYRLTNESITEPGGAMTVTLYSYDRGNNRETKTVTGGTEPGAWSYDYNTMNQLTGFTHTGGTPAVVSFAYDANGNRVSRTADGVTDSYTWDAENRLTQVNKAGDLHKYEYDYRTRRISREEPQSGVTVKTVVVFAGGLSAAEYGYTNSNLNAQPTVEYVRGPDLGGGVGGMLYSLRGEGVPVPKYSYPNGRGDVVAQADQIGAVTWTASYEAFGTHKTETGTNLDRQRANTKEEDPTGLLNEGFRYRDLETGTWLSRDPAGFVDGPNLYAYVKCNPWTKFDPMGLAASDDKTPPINLYSSTSDGVTSSVGIRTDLGSVWNDIKAPLSMVGSMAPGVGETMDAQTLFSGSSSNKDRAIAAGSLILNAVTGGLAPNFGKPAKLAGEGEALVKTVTKRGRESEERVLKALGEEKNTAKHSTSHGDTIPDFENPKQVGEIKDTKVVADTKQMKAQREAAEAQGKEHVVVTGDETKVTKPMQESSSKIERRSDLGPKPKDEKND